MKYKHLINSQFFKNILKKLAKLLAMSGNEKHFFNKVDKGYKAKAESMAIFMGLEKRKH